MQEFEKLSGRPYVVLYFNADAPMRRLPDTVTAPPPPPAPPLPRTHHAPTHALMHVSALQAHERHSRLAFEAVGKS